VPKRVDHEERRRQIADALVRTAATRGLHATGMREVAAEAGVSLRLVQYYFGTKEELLLAAMQQLAAQFAERSLTRLKEKGGPASPRDVIAAILTEGLPAGGERRTFTVVHTAYLALSLTDLALAISPAEPMAVEAEGRRVANALLDEVEAEADFDDGFIARFRASRVAEHRERTMRVVYPSGEVRVDFLAHTFENTTPFALDPNFEETPAFKDRLGASLAAFVAAARGERPAPLATALDGARALDLALAVEQAMAQQGLV